MRFSRRFLLPLCFAILVAPVATAVAQQLVPPTAAKRPYPMEMHGHVRVDDYYWMRERENPAVISWLNSENEYTRGMLEPTAELRQTLAGELKARIPQNDDSVPYPKSGYDWFSRITEGAQYRAFYRRLPQPGAKEELVVDANQAAGDSKFCSLPGVNPSPDGKTVAWAVDLVGRRKYTLKFRDMTTGEMLPDQCQNVTGSVVWAEDSKTVFYTRQDPDTLRSNHVFRHRLGTDPASDELVYDETDEEFSVGIDKTRSRKYIVISSDQTLSSECRIINAHHPETDSVVFLAREPDHEYSIDHIGDSFYVRTNWEAKNFRLMKSAEPGLDKSKWEMVVPHSDSQFLESFALFDNWLAISLLENGLTEIRYRTWDAEKFADVKFDEPCYSAGLAVTDETATGKLRYVYSSLRTPDSVFDFDMATGKSTLLKQTKIGGGFDRENYVAERQWATAQDGTKVPVSIVFRKYTPRDGSAPCLLYGYGSYGSSMSADFDPAIVSLLDRGWVYAIAHIRGGQEMGRAWYEDGKLLKKKNTFTDFIDCGKFLVAEKYCSPETLYGNGGSAGGLLIGAVANLAPELFHGLIAEVAFVDVVTTMLDETIPLTTSEYDEWGNPNDATYYRYMLSYSPYDNVQAKDYPHLLVTTGLHDSQVQYWEPAKWVARLRELKTGDGVLLMHTEMEAGHGGASGRLDQYRETALRHAFLIWLADKQAGKTR